MVTGREDDEQVHLGAEVDEVAGASVVGDEAERAGLGGGELAEEVDVGDEVAGVKAVFRELDKEVVSGVAVPVVAGGLVVFCAPLLLDVRGGVVAAEGIVPAKGIAGDGEHRAAHVGNEDEAGGQLGGVLALERVGHVVAVDQLVAVEAEEGDVGAGLEGGEAQGAVAADGEGPGGAAGEGFLKEQTVSGDDRDGRGRRAGGTRGGEGGAFGGGRDVK